MSANVVLAFTVPANEGFITDTANILTEEEERALESSLSTFQNETTNEIAVLIIKTLAGEPMSDVAVEVGRTWGIGTRENDNGILVLVAIDDREIFIATGYGLEGAVPDIVAHQIIEKEITPFFREGKYGEGIKGGIDALMMSTRGEYAPADSMMEESGGGNGFFVLFIIGSILLEWLAAILGRTKSWWLGGILGSIIGIVLFMIFSLWFLIPFLLILGTLFDYIVSKNYRSKRRTSFWAGGNWGPGGSSGGFGGLSGGSFGGGGAGGRW